MSVQHREYDDPIALDQVADNVRKSSSSHLPNFPKHFGEHFRAGKYSLKRPVQPPQEIVAEIGADLAVLLEAFSEVGLSSLLDQQLECH